jgi:Flp pilus assembly protein TadG
MLKPLARDLTGAAMIEFAMVLPVLLGLFLGTFVISDTLHCYRKVTASARTLADLVSRNVPPSSTPAASTLATYMNSAQLTLTPFAAANSTVEIDGLRVCDATHAYVLWTGAQTGSTATTPALTVGTVVTIPTGMITAPMIPTSPDGSNVCGNTVAAPNRTLVGTAGGYLLLGRAVYSYQPVYSFGSMARYNVADQAYMIPRLN